MIANEPMSVATMDKNTPNPSVIKEKSPNEAPIGKERIVPPLYTHNIEIADKPAVTEKTIANKC
jgi:hypothetical protein